MPRGREVDEAAPSDEPRTRETLTAMCHALLEHEAELNALDARVGDGDTGTTFATAARAVLSSIDALPLAEHGELCAAISKRLSEIMGGTSGVLLSIFAAAAGRTIATGAAGLPRCARGSSRCGSTAAPVPAIGPCSTRSYQRLKLASVDGIG